MSSLWFYQDPIDRLHQENNQFLRAQQRRFQTHKNFDNRQLEWKAEAEVIRQAQTMGYRVSRTVRNAPFDLWIEGARVEVKGATWHELKNGSGRYQAAIRNHNADVLIFDCINGTHHLFVIPMAEIAPRTHISIWKYHVEESHSRWVAFLEAWEYLEKAIRAGQYDWQLPLL